MSTLCPYRIIKGDDGLSVKVEWDVHYLTDEQIGTVRKYVAETEAENAELRELVRHMHTCLEHYEPGDTISCEQCPYDNETWGCDYERLMAELGVDA